MESLREEQARLLMFLREERQGSKEGTSQTPEQHLEARRWAEQWSLTREQGQRLGARQGLHRTPRDVERRIEDLKRELQELRGVQQAREVERNSSSPLSEEPLGDVLETSESLEKATLPTGEAQEGVGRKPRPAGFAETTTSKPAKVPPGDKKSPLAVWHPHPDDDVSPGQARTSSAAPVEMFRRHYDKYLENYEGYVKLAERIYRVRDTAEMPPGSLAERGWEERLRRVNDGIDRTTARLDLLEEYNAELATDDRISRRASIARSHAELERSRRARKRS
jgi:hypothetical protein